MESKIDLAALPFPVAYPLAFAANEALVPSERVDNVIFAAYQAMRVTGLLLLADYLACETASPNLAGAIRGLRMPHWGEWSVLCDKLSKFWRGDFPESKPERKTRFSRLVEGWLDVNRTKAPKQDPWAGLLGGLPGLQGLAKSANDAIQKARNDRTHRMATHTLDRGKDEALLTRLAPVLDKTLATLFPPGAFELVRRISTPDPMCWVIRLHGAHEDLRFEMEDLGPEWPGAFEATGVAALVESEVVPIYPLFVPGDDVGVGVSVPGGGMVEPVTLVDGVNEKRVVFLGVCSNSESDVHVGPLREALARKQVDLGLGRDETKLWTLADWSRVTAREGVNALRGRKYFPECYVDRRGVDDVVAVCIDRPGRGLLLLGEAGAGKSSLIARLAERLVDAAPADEEAPGKKSKGGDKLQTYLASKGRGDVVLLLSGRAAFAGDANAKGSALLCDAVMRLAGVRAGAFDDLNGFALRLAETANQDTQEGRRVWLLLDALNEADRFTDLLQALDVFLPALEKLPWLRLVVSMRSGAHHALERRRVDLAQHGDSVFSNARHLWTLRDERAGRDVPWLELRPFDLATEGPAAYAARQSRLPERAALIPYERLNPELRRLLLSPLHLHVFHETFRGRDEVPAVEGESELFDKYLDQLSSELPNMKETLRRLGVLMFETRRPELPLAVADEWVYVWRARLGFDSAARVVKLDPIEELVAASVLMRPVEEGFGLDRRLVAFRFSHQRLCEQVLHRELLRQIAPRSLPTAEELLAWAKHAAGAEAGAVHDGFAELVGALELVTTRLAAEGHGETLAALLDLDDEPCRTQLLGAAIRALGPAWGKTDEGETTPAQVLASLVKSARNIVRGERFDVSVRAAPEWLARHGFSLAAAAVAMGRVTVLRARVSAAPDRTDLQYKLAGSLNDISSLARLIGRGDDARRCAEESLALMRALVDAEPARPDLQLRLSGCLDLLGLLDLDGRDAERARRRLEESVALMRSLVSGQPHRADLKSGLAGSLEALGESHRKRGRREHAIRCCEESVAIMRSLAAAEPKRVDVQHWLAGSLVCLGNAASWAGRSEVALRCYEESLALVCALADAEPHRADLHQDRAGYLFNLGKLVREEGSGGDARRYLEECVAVARKLLDTEPCRVDLRLLLCLSLDHLGGLAQEEGLREEAHRCYKESLALSRALVDAEPDRVDLRLHLCSFLDNLGGVAQELACDEEARRCFEESLGIKSGLVEAEPDDADLRFELAASYMDLSTVAAEPGGARRNLRLVLDTLRPLRNRGLKDARVEELWRMASKVLGKRR